MAKAVEQGQVEVTLSSLSIPTVFPYPDRRILLSKDKPSMNIGRTSKRNSLFEAAIHTGWIDSAVMSRDHAKLQFDAKKQKVSIRDIGSLHGTFVNEQRLELNQPIQLKTGDTVQFGMTIDRGTDKFPSCVMRAGIRFGIERSDERPTVFRVPDDTDVEEIGSDDDAAVQHSSQILQSHNIRPAKDRVPSDAVTIDLTDNNNTAATSDSRKEKNTAHDTSSPTTDRQIRDFDYVDLTFPPRGDQNDVTSPTQKDYVPFSAASQADSCGADSQAFPGLDDISNDGNLLEALESVHGASTGTDSSVSSFLASSDTSDNNDEKCFLEETTILDLGMSPVQDGTKLPVNTFAEVPESGDRGKVFEAGISAEQSHLSISDSFESEAVWDPETQHKTVNTADLVLKAHLPPINSHSKDALPLAHTGTDTSSTVRLPSISETMPQPSFSPSNQHDRPNLADTVGVVTGKFEYFAAREQNKIRVHGAPSEPQSSVAKQCNISKASSGHEALNDASDTDTSLLFLGRQVPHGFEKPQPRKGGATLQSPDSISASAVNFPKSSHGDAGASLSNPPLKGTSSILFKPSDKAPNTPAVAIQRTGMGISDLVDNPTDYPKAQEPSRFMKRKVAEISQTMAEELGDVSINDSSKSLAQQGPAASHYSQGNRCNLLRQNDSNSRPTKRLRKVAEMFGFAALGGVAVMSALIATAPSL